MDGPTILVVAARPGNGAERRGRVILAYTARIAHIPATLIHSLHDVSGPLDTACELHKAWPASRLVVIDHAGHFGGSMGEQFRRCTGATGVSFGGAAAQFTIDSGTQITATSPPGTGTVHITVTTPAGTSPATAADQFVYTAGPNVTGVSPGSGPADGGTSVTITGSGFTGATSVSFGGAAAQFTIGSGTQITATSPPGNCTVDVTLTTPAGTSPATVKDQFATPTRHGSQRY